MQLVPDDFLWIAEDEKQALPEGARASTSVIATLIPKACNTFWQCGVTKGIDRMKKIRSTRMESIVGIHGIKPSYGISGINVATENLYTIQELRASSKIGTRLQRSLVNKPKRGNEEKRLIVKPASGSYSRWCSTADEIDRANTGAQYRP